jgi:hypothetical protein
MQNCPLEAAGIEPNDVTSSISKTYENPETLGGQKCGQVECGSTTLPPEVVELAKLLTSLSPGDRENLLQLAQALSTSPKDQVGPNPPDRVEI